nr:unnamed protein product [Timema tahoe]
MEYETVYKRYGDSWIISTRIEVNLQLTSTQLIFVSRQILLFIMYKLFVLATVVVAVVAQADRYPAGLNPALCPNFPLCDNALVALYNNPAPGAPIPYSAPVQTAAGYPAGVNPASCPNYPYCSNQVQVAPLPGYATREYPAGVSAAACPNYPYC